MRKRALAICLCVVLALGGVAATIAYFTDSDIAVNTLTVGKVDIDLTEYRADNSGNFDDTKVGFYYELLPGKQYSKKPVITVLNTSQPCWLFVSVDNQLKDVNGKNIEGSPTIESQMMDRGWAKLETYTLEGQSVDVYAKSDAALPNTKHVVFETFTVNGDAADNDAIAGVESKVIEIKAYAVQKAGFATAKEAWYATFGK